MAATNRINVEYTKLTIPEDENDLTLFILLGIIDDKVCDRETAAILALAWRSLYEEIISCRKNEAWNDLKWDKALLRTVSMLISRITAYGMKWKRWYIRIRHTTRAKLVPSKHRKYKLIQVNHTADYSINEQILTLHRRLTEQATTRA